MEIAAEEAAPAQEEAAPAQEEQPEAAPAGKEDAAGQAVAMPAREAAEGGYHGGEGSGAMQVESAAGDHAGGNAGGNSSDSAGANAGGNPGGIAGDNAGGSAGGNAGGDAGLLAMREGSGAMQADSAAGGHASGMLAIEASPGSRMKDTIINNFSGLWQVGRRSLSRVP